MQYRNVELDAETLFHTLFFDFSLEDDGTTYVETGDIPAMWLRDSSAQALPYVRFVAAYPGLRARILGVTQRNARNILTSSYANAFTRAYKLWEEKWEVDSLAYTVVLDAGYWSATHDRSLFTRQLHWAFQHIVATYECEQHHAACSSYRSRFLGDRGNGAPYSQTGMIWCAFRPSDDPVRYAYNIPQEMFAAQELDNLAQLAVAGFGDLKLARRASVLAQQIRTGIQEYGQVYDFRHGWLYAYEVDGQGNFVLMDDANIPNLLTLPLFGFVSPQESLYSATRRFVLSPDNPYWYRGRYGAGLGSPHTRTGWIWPLGLLGQALTAQSAGEVDEILAELRALDGGSGLFYESIDPNQPWHYTRSEFGWANAEYAELIFRCVAGLESVQPVRSQVPDLPAPLRRASYSAPRITTDLEAWNAAATIYGALSLIVHS